MGDIVRLRFGDRKHSAPETCWLEGDANPRDLVNTRHVRHRLSIQFASLVGSQPTEAYRAESLRIVLCAMSIIEIYRPRLTD